MQGRNHYVTLGLSASGLNNKKKPYSHKEIKKAFRKKAFQIHPDKNPNSKEEATKQFKLLHESCDILLGKEPHTTSTSEPTTVFSKEKEFKEIVHQLDTCSISIHQLREKFGYYKADTLIDLYLWTKKSYWTWPKNEKSAKNDMIYQLIIDERLHLADIINFSDHELRCLLGKNSDYQRRRCPPSGCHCDCGSYKCGDCQDSPDYNFFNYPTISEAWQKYLTAIKKPIDWQEFMGKQAIMTILFPLIREKIVSEDRLKNITDEIRYKPYLRLMHTTSWEDPIKARTHFAKIQERMPYYSKIMKIFLECINAEIKRVKKHTGYCFWHSWKNKVEKIKQLKESKLIIENLALSKICDLDNKKVEDWNNDLQQLLVAKIKILANDSKINSKRNHIGYFLKKLIGIILAVSGLGMPLAFTTYRDTFFKTETAATLHYLARHIDEAPEYKTSSLKT